MDEQQCRFTKNNGKRCALKATKKKQFCTIHQNTLGRLSSEELMQEITKATRSYLKLTPEHPSAILDPERSSHIVPALANLVFEATNRGYRYKDLQTHFESIYKDWLRMTHLPIARQMR